MKKQVLLVVTALCSLTAMAQVPSYVPSNGLVAYYPMDGNGNDISGYNNNLISTGNISYTQDVHWNVNSACHFVNGNDYFTTPSTSWTLINNFPTGSLSFWVKIDSMYISGHYFGIGNSFIVKEQIGVGEDLVFVMQDGTTKMRMQISGTMPGGSSTDVIGNTSLQANTWYHIVGVWDGVHHTLYVNGLQDGQISNSNGIPNRPTPDYFSIGSIQYGGNGTTTFPSGAYGSMDDIGIWNRALTQQEITDLYNSNSCNLSISTQPINQTAAPGNSAQFTVTSSSLTSTYQWQTNMGLGFQNISNAGQYSGATNDTLSISNCTLSNNNQLFRCIINDANCTDTSTTVSLSINNNAGISEWNTNINAIISPNPFTSQTSITFTQEQHNTIIKVTDVLGKEIKSTTFSGKQYILEKGELNAGIYFISVNSEQGIVNRKIIIQ